MTSPEAAFGAPDPGERSGRLALGFVLPYGIALLVAALWVRLADLPSLFRAPESLSLAIWLLAGILFGLLTVRALSLLEEQDWYRAMARWLKQMLRASLGAQVSWSDAAIVALASSIGEEALFRGALQSFLILHLQRLLGEAAGAVLGLLGASLLFGIAHAPLVKQLRPWTLLAVLLGLALGLLTLASGFLGPAIAAHATINAINLRRLATSDLSGDAAS